MQTTIRTNTNSSTSFYVAEFPIAINGVGGWVLKELVAKIDKSRCVFIRELNAVGIARHCDIEVRFCGDDIHLRIKLHKNEYELLKKAGATESFV